jgi:hypothetical protein
MDRVSRLKIFYSCAKPKDVLTKSRLRSQFQLLSRYDDLVRLARQRSEAGNVIKCDRLAWYEIKSRGVSIQSLTHSNFLPLHSSHLYASHLRASNRTAIGTPTNSHDLT